MIRIPIDHEDFDRAFCSVATAILGAGALGAGASIWGANTAANAQTNAANAGIAAQKGMFTQGLGVAQGALQPFISGGTNALSTLQSLLTPGANQTAALSQIPGFQFAQDWGQKGVSAQATTRGLGGNALAAGGQYATGLAQQSFGGIVNSLQGLLSTGAGAAQTLGSSALGNATSTGAGIGQLTAGIGNAQAGGAIGTANAIGGLGGSAVNATLLSRLLNGGNAGTLDQALNTGNTTFSPGAGPGIYNGSFGW
jgi:hypothetical protein